jgi:cytolysin-activating lysine-acyltransferase
MILGQSKPEAAGSHENAQATDANALPIRPHDVRNTRLAQSFAQVVAVLMRDPNFKQLPLADLEWLVLPPLMAGQFRLAHMTSQPGNEKQPGMMVPVAVALWARVSPAIDQKLSENLDVPLRLQAYDWVSGDNLWLMVAAGDPRAIPPFMHQLQESEFKDAQVKLRRRGPDGKAMVATLGQA